MKHTWLASSNVHGGGKRRGWWVILVHLGMIAFEINPVKAEGGTPVSELLSVGPTTVGEDEEVIGKSYRLWPQYLVPAVIPLGVAWFADAKWVIAAGFALIIMLAPQIDGRLHDLCVRMRRTNLLLREIRGNDS
jgi:hypothetical protein